MSAITNAKLLNDIVLAAQTEPVAVLINSESNTYTFGGWQQALALSMRNLAPILGYCFGASGQSTFNTVASPGFTTDADRFAAQGGPNLGSASGAPPAQEAMFPMTAAMRNYRYVADGVAPARFANWMRTREFSGMNARDAQRTTFYGVSFADGPNAVAPTFQMRRATSPASSFGPVGTFESVTGGVDYISHSIEIAQDDTRDLDVVYEANINATAMVGPLMFTGASRRSLTLDHGFIFGTLMHWGGHSSAENTDDYVKSRANYREAIRQMRDTMGQDGKVLIPCNFINDSTSRSTSASWGVGGVLDQGGTSTQITVPDATGIEAGALLVISDATTEGVINGSYQNHVVDSVAGNTVTVTQPFARTPLAGDVWRSSPAGTEADTKEGRKLTFRFMLDLIKEDCLSFGLTPTFVDIPRWRTGQASTDDIVDMYEDAGAELAEERDDLVGVRTSQVMDLRETLANTGSDRDHPGAYFLASLAGRIFCAAQENTETLNSAQIASDVLAAIEASDALADPAAYTPTLTAAALATGGIVLSDPLPAGHVWVGEVGDEKVRIDTTVTPTVHTRGYDGTTAAAHSAGTNVRVFEVQSPATAADILAIRARTDAMAASLEAVAGELAKVPRVGQTHRYSNPATSVTADVVIEDLP